jgi:hypothetical protein
LKFLLIDEFLLVVELIIGILERRRIFVVFNYYLVFEEFLSPILGERLDFVLSGNIIVRVWNFISVGFLILAQGFMQENGVLSDAPGDNIHWKLIVLRVLSINDVVRHQGVLRFSYFERRALVRGELRVLKGHFILLEVEDSFVCVRQVLQGILLLFVYVELWSRWERLPIHRLELLEDGVECQDWLGNLRI